MPIMMAAKSQNLQAKLVRDTLIINGQKYKDLKSLPMGLRPEDIAVKETDTEIFFYGQHSPYSNFNTAYPIEIDQQTFNCSEQMYHFEKARYFKDKDAMEKILQTKDPIQQKKVNIKGFKQEEWQKKSEKVMEEIIRVKCEQNSVFRDILCKKTGKKTLIEANPHDPFWGIGLGLRHPNLQDSGKWGLNIFGKVLMRAREALKH